MTEMPRNTTAFPSVPLDFHGHDSKREKEKKCPEQGLRDPNYDNPIEARNVRFKWFKSTINQGKEGVRLKPVPSF